jgi:hypothetical protein
VGVGGGGGEVGGGGVSMLTVILVLFDLFYHIFTVKQSWKLAPDQRTPSDKFPGGPVVFVNSPDRLSGKLFCQPLPL